MTVIFFVISTLRKRTGSGWGWVETGLSVTGEERSAVEKFDRSHGGLWKFPGHERTHFCFEGDPALPFGRLADQSLNARTLGVAVGVRREMNNRSDELVAARLTNDDGGNRGARSHRRLQRSREVGWMGAGARLELLASRLQRHPKRTVATITRVITPGDAEIGEAGLSVRLNVSGTEQFDALMTRGTLCLGRHVPSSLESDIGLKQAVFDDPGYFVEAVCR